MTVKAKVNFVDGHGKERNIGDVWKMGCDGCAQALIKAGKVEKVNVKKA